MLKKLTSIALLALATASFATVVTNKSEGAYTAEDLADVIIGDGISVVGPVTYSGVDASAGVYSGSTVEAQGNSKLSDGLVLSSGSVDYLEHTSNTSDNISLATGSGTDSDLQSLIPGYTVNDATYLEFDFVAEGEVGQTVTASFWYVFGSDEYDEWVGSAYNDVFGFFLNDENIAVIPGTTTPVAINTINAGDENGPTPASNSEYYNDNDPSKLGTPTPYATEMDGFTVPMYVEFTVDAGSLNNMKLAIGDAGDQIYDSWVMIGGESFVNKPHDDDIPEPSMAWLLGLGVAGLFGAVRRKRS